MAMEVFKFDGTRQCGLGSEITVEEMAAELVALGVKPSSQEKRKWPGFIIQVCGNPTGNCNVYAVSDSDWKSHKAQILGAGFREWPAGNPQAAVFSSHLGGGSNPMGGDGKPWPMGGDGRPWPFSTTSSPTLDPSKGLGEIIGKRLRVYHDGDMITQDYRLDRVNIVLHPATSLVIDVWFG